MLHDVCLRLWGSAHFQNAAQLPLVSLVLLHQGQIRLLDDLDWITENFDAPFDPHNALADIVEVGVAWLTTRLANLLQAGQVEQRVLQLFKVELELVGGGIADFFYLEQLLEVLVCHRADDLVQEQILVNRVEH